MVDRIEQATTRETRPSIREGVMARVSINDFGHVIVRLSYTWPPGSIGRSLDHARSVSLPELMDSPGQRLDIVRPPEFRVTYDAPEPERVPTTTIRLVHRPEKLEITDTEYRGRLEIRLDHFPQRVVP